MLRKLLSIAVAALFVPGVLLAQGTITGTITDDESGESLPGANVLIEELGRGAATNIDGVYTLTNVPNGTYTLVASFVGYKKMEKSVEITGGTSTVDFALSPDYMGLEEVVVTGFSEIDRQAFTGKVSTVSSENIEDIPISSPTEALQGNAAGVSVTSATGTPGAVTQIRIRGLSSINAGVDPLFVIDGVPVIGGDNATSTVTSSLGVLSSISPSDIESITVLKDAASTAPYGARGTNGVVVITTKQGKFGNTTYSAKAQRGYNNRAVPGEGALNASEWDKLYYDSGGNLLGDLGFPTDKATVDAVLGASGWDNSTDTDWGKVVRNEDAVQQSFNLSARGGNEDTKFYASGSYFKQEGQTIGSGLNRVSGKFDISHQLDERVKVQNSFTGSWVEQDGILEGAGYFGSPVLAEYFMLPIDAAYNEDGSPNIDNLNVAIFNPVYVQENDIDRKRNYRLINNTKVDVTLAENLILSSRMSIDYMQTEEKYYNDPFYGDSDDTNGSVNDISNRNFNYVWQNRLQYYWYPAEDHDVTLQAISESQRNYYARIDAYGEGFAADGLHNLTSTASPQFVGGITEDWAVQSFTALANYGFQKKLYADVSFRYEGSSRFASDERWGSFYSLGLGYVLSEEAFMQDFDWLNNLKIRASAGKTGNASVDLNQYQATVGFGSYNDLANIQTNQLGNRNLTWETANSIDIGVDFELFERLSGSVTAFKKTSKDLLYGVPLSFTTGHEDQVQNIGELYNQGIEVELNADIIRTKDFAWNLGGNFSTLKNEVTKLPLDGNGDPIELTTATRWRAVEGYELNAWYMREWAGVDPDTGDPLWYMDDGNGGRTTTNQYNQADRYYQGASALPTVTAGINTRIDVMDFYVSANIYYSGGNKVYDSWAYYMRSDGAFSPAFGQYERQADYWEQPGDVAENPRPVFGGNLLSNETSSRFLYDGDYIRLRTVNIGYNVPTRFAQQIGLKSATVYFLGQNLWTYAFDDDLKYDPQVRADGFLDLNAAPLRSVTFGINVNF